MNRFQIKEIGGEQVGILRTTYKDNKFIDEQYKRVLENFESEDEYFYSVYALGEWTPLKVSGRIYRKFADENILTGDNDWKYTKELPVILCCDFNVEIMKWALIQNHQGIDYVFDEIIMKDADTESMCNMLADKYGLSRYVVYGDYSGTFRSVRKRTTDYKIIEGILGIPKLSFFLKPNPPVIDRVNAVNWRLCSKEGKRRLFVNESCENTIRDFRRVVWKENPDGSKDRRAEAQTEELSHISSAIGYYINYQYSLKGKSSAKWSQM